jgi:2-polyprenyl-6-methoxyphenol hydroxylase-like FAD-dependent oxidoreductase
VAKEVARRMGLDQQIRAACTDTRGMSVVNRKNKRLAELRADQFEGDGMIAEIEILRGDLSAVLYGATKGDVEYVFGDRITELDETGNGVEARFASGVRRDFDVVVGADGLHSSLRAMVFGPEAEFVHHLGYLLCFFTVPNRLNLDSWALGYSEPGRMAGVRSIRNNKAAMAFLSIHAEPGGYDFRDTAGHKALLREQLAGMAWEVPWLLEQMDTADDFYFDTCSQTRMEHWSKGRVVLLGDAAFCPSPISGQGTSLAMIGAYVLAGELATSSGEHTAAFAEYERRMRGIVEATQKMGRDNAKRNAARNNFQLWVQRQLIRLMPYPPLKNLVTREMNKAINGIDLPDYRDLSHSS